MWLKQFIAVVNNSVRVVVGDAFFLVLHLSALLLIALLAAIPGFTYGEHIRLLRDQCQALIFMVGCLTITYGFIRVFTNDLRVGTGSILMSRPIGSFCVISGKWTGVLISVLILGISLLVSYLWASEIAYDAGFLNTSSMILFLSSVVVALGLSALRHYLFGGSYVLSANFILTNFIIFFFISRVITKGQSYFDWHGCQSGIILFFGLMAFSAFLLPVAILIDSVVVLGIAVLVFFFGLISEHFVSVIFDPGAANMILRSILPNWQYYWVADRIGEGHTIPLGYFIACVTQAICLVGVCMMIAVIVYENKEVDNRL